MKTKPAQRDPNRYYGEKPRYIAPERLKFLDVPSIDHTGQRVLRAVPIINGRGARDV